MQTGRANFSPPRMTSPMISDSMMVAPAFVSNSRVENGAQKCSGGFVLDFERDAIRFLLCINERLSRHSSALKTRRSQGVLQRRFVLVSKKKRPICKVKRVIIPGAY